MIFFDRLFRHRLPLRSLGACFLLTRLLTAPAPACGQEGGLRDDFLRLFTFGSGCGPETLFCLVSSGGSPDVASRAFSDNADATAGSLSDYLQGAIVLGLAAVPAPSAGSGEAFRLSPLGVPVRNQEVSLGPIIAERFLTLGRGNFLAGANLTNLRFETLRGVQLEGLQFNVVQEDLPPEGLGDPALERTYIAVETRMAFEATMANFFLTAGITDRLDLSILVPVVQATLSGFSDADIIVGEGQDPAAGFSFGGPAEDPRLRARAELPPQKATGLGDASIRGKLRFNESDSRFGLALLGGLRMPTGKEEDFLGSEGWSVQGLGVVSTAPFGGFSPHLNLGGVFRTADGERSAIVGALGFDHRATDRLTLAGELLAQFPLGEDPLAQVQRVDTIYGDGTPVVVPTSNLPTLADHQFDGALGFKLRLGPFALFGNAILPLNDGGLRSDVVWTLGLQGGF